MRSDTTWRFTPMILAICVVLALVAACAEKPAENKAAQPAPPAPAQGASPAQPAPKMPMANFLMTPTADWVAYYDGIPADTSRLYFTVARLIKKTEAQDKVIAGLETRIALLEKLAATPTVTKPTYDNPAPVEAPKETTKQVQKGQGNGPKEE